MSSPNAGESGVLHGQVAIVTGAGQGVGRGVALALAGEGAKVAAVGRTVSKCQDVAHEIAGRGGEAVALRCDVERREEVDAVVSDAVARWGRVDVLVNNAQSRVYRSLRRMTEDDMATMWHSGPMGALRFMQACFTHLRESRGCVVNMGSGSSVLPQGQMGGYAMTKEAVRVLSRVAALEWGRFGIRVNSICPLAMTPGMTEFGEAAEGAVEDQVVPMIPLGRFGDPETDIGRAVIYLASRDGSYVTGSTLMVDGGYNYLR